MHTCTCIQTALAVDMSHTDGKTFAVYVGECNTTFKCCELNVHTQGYYMAAMTPNSTHIAPEEISEAEFVNYDDSMKCVRLTMYPHPSNNGIFLRCTQGGSTPINNTLKFQVEAQINDTTVVNTTTQGIHLYMYMYK